MKLPPREKIPEAWSVLADGRIEMKDTQARIISSDHKKEYTVDFKDETYGSNDSATHILAGISRISGIGGLDETGKDKDKN